MALLIALGVAVLAIVAHFLLQRRAARLAPPAPAPVPDIPRPPADGAAPPEPPFLVGRRELSDRIDELASMPAPEPAGPRARAAALVGPPGIGKTALALDYAHVALPDEGEAPDADDFVGRVWFELGASTTTPPSDELAHLELARAVLGRAAAGLTDDELRSRLAAALTERRLLVILDDARDGAQVDRLIAAHPGPRLAFVVVTSRAPLGLDGVPELPVGPLDAEAAAEILLPRADTRADGDADDHVEALAALTPLLDGHPLALVIAEGAIVTTTISAPALRDAVAARRQQGQPPHLAVRDALLAHLGDSRAATFRALADATAAGALTLGALHERLPALRDTDDLPTLLDLELVESAGTTASGQPLFRVPHALRAN